MTTLDTTPGMDLLRKEILQGSERLRAHTATPGVLCGVVKREVMPKKESTDRVTSNGSESAGSSGGPPARHVSHFPRGPRYNDVPTWQLALSIAGIIALAIWMLWVTVGCAGSSPTEAGITEISTAYGTVTVLGTMDADAVRQGIEDGYELVNAQGPWTLDATGLTVMHGDGVRWHGRYYRDRDLVEVARPSDLVHEVEHRAAWQLGRHAECRELQGHRPGFDLHCNRRET